MPTAAFSPTPSIERTAGTTIGVAASVPKAATAVGVPVAASGPIDAQLGLDRRRLKAVGFDASIGSTLVMPSAEGATVLGVGVGDPGDVEGQPGV